MTDPWAGAAIDLVERVSDALAARAVPCVLIGAAAMAVHGYPRATQDLDLGVVDVPLATLRDLANELRQTGLSVELREPDGDDPLGGLLRIDVDDELQIDVVNFGNPFTGRSRREGRLAIESPTVGLEGRRLRVAGLVPLIVLMLLIQAATVTGDFASGAKPIPYGVRLSISSLLLLLCLCVKDYAWSALRRWAVRRRVERISNGCDAEGACAIVGLNPSGMGTCFGSVGRIIWDAGWLQLDDGGIHYRSTMAGFRIAWTDITDIRPGIWYIGVCPNHSSRILWNDSDAREREGVLFDLAYPSNRRTNEAVALHELMVKTWRSRPPKSLKTDYSLDVQPNASGPQSINANLVSTLIANAYLPFCLFLVGYPAFAPIHTSVLGAYLPAALALTAHTMLIYLRAWMTERSHGVPPDSNQKR